MKILYLWCAAMVFIAPDSFGNQSIVPNHKDTLIGYKPFSLKVEHLQATDVSRIGGYVGFPGERREEKQARIRVQHPIFSWEIPSGYMQKSYRIIVSDDKNQIRHNEGGLWDSGSVLDDNSITVIYAGPDLQPSETYYWKVKIGDDKGGESEWSAAGVFHTDSVLTNYATSYYPLQKTDSYPDHMAANGRGELFVDFGKAAFGQLKFTVSAASRGKELRVRLGEKLNKSGRIDTLPGGTIRFAEYRVKLLPGINTYELLLKPDPRNTGANAIRIPKDIGEVLPFRYVEFLGLSDGISVENVVRPVVHYPFDDYASFFTSSDTVLNAIWELSKYSIKATSFTGMYVDGDRERIPYEADAYINQLCHYGVDQEYSMARRTYEYLIFHATWPTEWILQSVLMAYNDYLYTGDIRSAQQYYEQLRHKLLLPLREANGLISTRKGKQSKDMLAAIHFNGDALRDIVDWPHPGSFGMKGKGETDGFVFTDFNTVVNAFHYKALRNMEKLASALGKHHDSAEYSNLARDTYAAFQKYLWDDHIGAYRDGIETNHCSLHSNMMAMAFGLVPPQYQASVLEFIRSRGMACSVYGSQFLLDAVYKAGAADYGLSLLASTEERSWYNMIRKGSTITMEAWDDHFKPNQDWNHAWGAVPANIIPRKLMGIEPTQPGWSRFRFCPAVDTLSFAHIKVPTMRGEVEVQYERKSKKTAISIVIPGNSVCDVELPLSPGFQSARPKLLLNGSEITVNETGIIRIPGLRSGKYLIELFQ